MWKWTHKSHAHLYKEIKEQNCGLKNELSLSLNLIRLED
jgi:hypothetical protein